MLRDNIDISIKIRNETDLSNTAIHVVRDITENEKRGLKEFEI